ncbi:MAG: polyhydroxyalkanoate synthesis regulator DNA-binding domain-containing protein [Desulfobacteraceae bacterium]
MPEPVILKKYANRRLYDTEKSAYVTLSQVADYIKRGRQVSIFDAKSNEDVTAFILTQIVLEEAKNKNALLPVPMLHMIIRYGDNLLAEFFEKYFYQIFQNFVSHKQAMDNQFQQWVEMGFNMSDAAQKGLAQINPFQSFFETFGSTKNREDADPDDIE